MSEQHSASFGWSFAAGPVTPLSWQPGDLILLAGPTGTGKTALSLDLAERLIALGHPAEIVNGDAMQLYRGMDIGTAKIPVAERRGIPHHLFDVLEVTETSTVSHYQRLARETIAGLRAQGITPILVGGSGLYLSAVIHEMHFPGTDPEIRARLEAEADQLAREWKTFELWERLSQQDPAAAAAISAGNVRRVIRALEVIEITGKPYSAHLPEAAASWVPTAQFFLDGDRDVLRQRLRVRAEQMWDGGLVEEVRGLLDRGLREGQTASRAIGYAQAIAVIDGTMSVEAGLNQTEALTIRYARRQRSWFNRYGEMVRLDYRSDNLAEQVLEYLGLAA